MAARLKLARYIAGYEKDGEKRVWTHYLSDFSIEAYARMFDLGDDPRMFLCYQIVEENRAEIERLTGVELDLARHDCFLECGTTDDPEIPGEPLGKLDEETGYPPPLLPPAWIEGAVPVKPR